MEEDSFQDDENEVDEDLEAMLYSQIHYEYNDTEGLDITAALCSSNSTSEAQHVFTVTPMKTDHSNVSLRDAVRRSDDDNAVAHIQKESAVKGDISFQNQTPDINSFDTSKEDDRDAGHAQQMKSKFDMEAELGISASPPTKKHKAKHSKAFKSSKPKFSETGAALLTSDFIKIDEHAPQTEKNYRKTLSRLLTNHSSSKKVKEVIVIKSDSCSTSSSSEGEKEPASVSECESSSVSDSESDIELLGSTTPDQSINKSAAEITLDLNWNVTSADRQTIERVEKRSSEAEESKWKIDDADLPSVSRYYAKKELRCRNCDKEGHISKVCPTPKKKPSCGLCGTEGHSMHRCPKSLCFNCSQPGHRGSDCPLPKRDRFSKCARCQMKGHAEDECPDLWRQYHSTITSEEDLTPRRKEVNPRIFCCNCAKQGHFAHECWRDRMDKFTFPSSPFIIKYDVASVKGRKGSSQSKSTDRRSEHTYKAKRFKFDHHHNTSQSKEDQTLYPRRYQNSGHRSEPHNQRYFSTQTSTHSIPHQQGILLSHRFTHRSQEKDGQHVHFTRNSPDQEGGTHRRPYLSVYTKKFLQHSLQDEPSGKTAYQGGWSDGDKYFDWQGGGDSRYPSKKSHKRQSPSAWKKDGPTSPKKKKNWKKGDRSWNQKPHASQQQIQGWAEVRKKQDKQLRGKTGGIKSYHSSSQPDQGRTWTKRKHQSRSHQGRQEHRSFLSQPGTSTRGMESLTIACKSGFRTTVRTMNFIRNSRNTQHY